MDDWNYGRTELRALSDADFIARENLVRQRISTTEARIRSRTAQLLAAKNTPRSFEHRHAVTRAAQALTAAEAQLRRHEYELTLIIELRYHERSHIVRPLHSFVHSASASPVSAASAVRPAAAPINSVTRSVPATSALLTQPLALRSFASKNDLSLLTPTLPDPRAVVQALVPYAKKFIALAARITFGLHIQDAIGAFERNPAHPDAAPPHPVRSYCETLFTPPALALVLDAGKPAVQQLQDAKNADAVAPHSEHMHSLPALLPLILPNSPSPLKLLNLYEHLEQERQMPPGQAQQFEDCHTQNGDDIASLVVGPDPSTQNITLWENNTKLSWFTADDLFEDQVQFTLVESAMLAATDAWNLVAPGGIQFMRAKNENTATFVVRYTGNKWAKKATGFFPAQYVPGINRLHIYKNGIAAGARLSASICHELGHILGFRHSFLIGKTPKVGKALGSFEGIYKHDDAHSIMRYGASRKITLYDVMDSRAIYATLDNTLELDSGGGKLIKINVVRIAAK